MKTQIQNPEKQQATGRLWITGGMVACLMAGWFIGSITTDAFSQSAPKTGSESTTLLTIPFNGENLPTIMLDEFSVTANQNLKR